MLANEFETLPEICLAPRRLGHVNLFVDDVDTSLEFYRIVCGFDEVFAESEILAVFLGNGNTHHDLALMGVTSRARVGRDGHVQVAADRGRAAGLNHLGFEMPSERDLVEAIERARERGFAFHRVVDHQISHSVYMFDPDGNYIEAYADVTPQWRRLFSEAAGQLITGTWRPDPSLASAMPQYEVEPEIVVSPAAILHPRRVSGATLVVQSLSASRAFYESVIGLRVLDEVDGAIVMGGSLGHRDLVLVAQRSGDTLGLHHFTVELLDDTEYAATAARLNEAGVGVQLTIDNSTKSSFVLVDPDGLRVEFVNHQPGSGPRGADRHWVG